MTTQTQTVQELLEQELALKQRLDQVRQRLAELGTLPDQPPAKKIIHCHFQVRAFRADKHGHAYVAKLLKKDNQLAREFLPSTTRAYDSKRKYYDTDYLLDLEVGTVLEARLDAGTWAKDHRSWYLIEEDGPKEISQQQARSIVLGI
jgi:hypothetical protein